MRLHTGPVIFFLSIVFFANRAFGCAPYFRTPEWTKQQAEFNKLARPCKAELAELVKGTTFKGNRVCRQVTAAKIYCLIRCVNHLDDLSQVIDVKHVECSPFVKERGGKTAESLQMTCKCTYESAGKAVKPYKTEKFTWETAETEYAAFLRRLQCVANATSTTATGSSSITSSKPSTRTSTARVSTAAGGGTTSTKVTIKSSTSTTAIKSSTTSGTVKSMSTVKSTTKSTGQSTTKSAVSSSTTAGVKSTSSTSKKTTEAGGVSSSSSSTKSSTTSTQVSTGAGDSTSTSVPSSSSSSSSTSNPSSTSSPVKSTTSTQSGADTSSPSTEPRTTTNAPSTQPSTSKAPTTESSTTTKAPTTEPSTTTEAQEDTDGPDTTTAVESTSTEGTTEGSTSTATPEVTTAGSTVQATTAKPTSCSELEAVDSELGKAMEQVDKTCEKEIAAVKGMDITPSSDVGDCVKPKGLQLFCQFMCLKELPTATITKITYTKLVVDTDTPEDSVLSWHCDYTYSPPDNIPASIDPEPMTLDQIQFAMLNGFSGDHEATECIKGAMKEAEDSLW